MGLCPSPRVALAPGEVFGPWLFSAICIMQSINSYTSIVAFVALSGRDLELKTSSSTCSASGPRIQ
jgi:hypothetical protein